MYHCTSSLVRSILHLRFDLDSLLPPCGLWSTFVFDWSLIDSLPISFFFLFWWMSIGMIFTFWYKKVIMCTLISLGKCHFLKLKISICVYNYYNCLQNHLYNNIEFLYQSLIFLELTRVFQFRLTFFYFQIDFSYWLPINKTPYLSFPNQS